jgi:hypothetical protein
MGATGTATVNFGGFPGSDSATVLVTGQTGIVAGSLVEAWLVPTATGDHSADEHIMVGPRIEAGNIVPGTGFTIYAMQLARKSEPDAIPRFNSPSQQNVQNVQERGRVTSMTYGQWSVAWVWN